jgi:hypothetical protein
MTIEEFVVSYLNTMLPDVPASGDAPAEKPDEFITVEKTGERVKNYIPKATVVVESWAQSRTEARVLSGRVRNAMLGIMGEAQVMSCQLNSEYNYPSEETKRARYQQSFDIVYDHIMISA